MFNILFFSRLHTERLPIKRKATVKTNLLFRLAFEIYIFNFNRSAYLKCAVDTLIKDLKVVPSNTVKQLSSNKKEY